jgi:hypothetical protein
VAWSNSLANSREVVEAGVELSTIDSLSKEVSKRGLFFSEGSVLSVPDRLDTDALRLIVEDKGITTCLVVDLVLGDVDSAETAIVDLVLGEVDSAEIAVVDLVLGDKDVESAVTAFSEGSCVVVWRLVLATGIEAGFFFGRGIVLFLFFLAASFFLLARINL